VLLKSTNLSSGLPFRYRTLIQASGILKDVPVSGVVIVQMGRNVGMPSRPSTLTHSVRYHRFRRDTRSRLRLHDLYTSLLDPVPEPRSKISRLQHDLHHSIEKPANRDETSTYLRCAQRFPQHAAKGRVQATCIFPRDATYAREAAILDCGGVVVAQDDGYR
jgi:hypothetical protein